MVSAEDQTSGDGCSMGGQWQRNGGYENQFGYWGLEELIGLGRKQAKTGGESGAEAR
jgi:hypothetical protein